MQAQDIITVRELSLVPVPGCNCFNLESKSLPRAVPVKTGEKLGKLVATPRLNRCALRLTPLHYRVIKRQPDGGFFVIEIGKIHVD